MHMEANRWETIPRKANAQRWRSHRLTSTNLQWSSNFIFYFPDYQTSKCLATPHIMEGVENRTTQTMDEHINC